METYPFFCFVQNIKTWVTWFYTKPCKAQNDKPQKLDWGGSITSCAYHFIPSPLSWGFPITCFSLHKKSKVWCRDLFVIARCHLSPIVQHVRLRQLYAYMMYWFFLRVLTFFHWWIWKIKKLKKNNFYVL